MTGTSLDQLVGDELSRLAIPATAVDRAAVSTTIRKVLVDLDRFADLDGERTGKGSA